MVQKICKRCVMDITDPNIVFDENGYCKHCSNALEQNSKIKLNLEEKNKELKKIVNLIKKNGKNKRYDCIIGVSGGVDSTYVAYLVKKLGLKPLAVHLDNGWNSELAITNIENTLKKLDIDLYTRVLNWEEFKDLQLSFLKASVPDLEIPTDHAIIATLYEVAHKFGIKYIISGHNIITESIGVPMWSNGHYDWKYISSLQKKFGNIKLVDYPKMTPLNIFYYQFIKDVKMIRILNYVNYDKKKVLKIIEKEFNWKNYPTKHGESIYTHFIQSYILPEKFGYDKRKCHLSNLICSEQTTRAEALCQLKKPLFTPKELEELINYSCDKFEISRKEFESLMKLPNKSYYDYPSYENSKFYKFLRETYKKIRVY
ncbi:N-acetyl sugar amidotransferase [Methanococcus maripaludis]|uniref:N-acetyl sugar amidotransferase n=1 Tax=Methanococcus maripaludis TaxID=39152 RepID=A0A7J9PSG1_METMI|nr:N-acetyl sugar amidotransferase [Methanococcus maripaludis]MBA2868491.1 N-acetyl sugar amidotransferase [Methanococcus maripaludis]